MSDCPPVTVLLAVYNGLRFLPEAVESVLRQSFGDFELLTIDDGSTDGCGRYLDSLSDPRLRVIHNRRNLGLTASLNLGLRESRGRYIARMDADDICNPDRLARQIEFLERHPSVGILGCSRRLIDESGVEVRTAPATQGDRAIRWKCLLGNPFAHPTVMLRRSVLDEHGLRYDETFRTAQDYELWTRLLPHTHGENLAEPLLSYRLRGGISRLSKIEQLANHDRIAHAACRRLLPQLALSVDEVRQLRGRFGGFSVRETDMNPCDSHWTDTYQRMRRAFTIACGDEPTDAEFVLAEQSRIGAVSPRKALQSARRATLIMVVPTDPNLDDERVNDRPSPLDLNYRSGRDDQRERNLTAGAAIGVGVLSTLTVLVLVAFWIMENLDFQETPHPQRPLGWTFSGTCTLAAAIIWVWALRVRRSRRYILAALIGIGAAILIEGACFIAAARR